MKQGSLIIDATIPSSVNRSRTLGRICDDERNIGSSAIPGDSRRRQSCSQLRGEVSSLSVKHQVPLDDAPFGRLSRDALRMFILHRLGLLAVLTALVLAGQTAEPRKAP